MARTIAEIQAQMDTEQSLQTGLSGLNSPSQVAIYTLWKYIMSAAIFAHEALWDLFKAELEATSNATPTGTELWVKTEIDKFQYSSTTPQIVTLVNFVPAYSIINTELQIITRASVATLPSRLVSVKVAKSDPPVALAVAELNSLVSYLGDIGYAGVEFLVVSKTSDKLFLEAEIFYDGQYASTISATVIAALDAYLAAIPFDGNVRIQDVTDAVQAVTGVKDIIITGLAMRADATALGSATYLVAAKATVFNKYPTDAGYIVQETTASNTFTDKLTFTPES